MRQMAYRKIIRINPYSRSSITSAIKELEAEKKRREDMNHRFLDILGDYVAERVDERLSSVSKNTLNQNGYDRTSCEFVTMKDGREGIAVRAMGVQIAFIEFGAGAEANPGIYNYTKGDANDFYPGSWSIEHGQTYQGWERAGYPGMYEFEQPPARGFDTAISELHEIIERAIKEVLND